MLFNIVLSDMGYDEPASTRLLLWSNQGVGREAITVGSSGKRRSHSFNPPVKTSGLRCFYCSEEHLARARSLVPLNIV